MDVRHFIGSNYLAKEDLFHLNGQQATVTIQHVGSVEVEDGEHKLTVSVAEFPKPLVVNKTNIRVLADLFGSLETDDWIGKRFNLYVDPHVSFAGRVVGGLRVRSETWNVPSSQPPQFQNGQPGHARTDTPGAG